MTTLQFVPHPTPDLPLLRKHLDWVREQARRGEDSDWDQDVWVYLREASTTADRRFAEVPSCNTYRCFAGNVVLEAGAQFVIDPGIAGLNHLLAEPDDYECDVFNEPDYGGVELVTINDRARRLLGITDGEAEELFCETDTYEDIEDAVRRIFRRAGEEL